MHSTVVQMINIKSRNQSINQSIVGINVSYKTVTKLQADVFMQIYGELYNVPEYSN